MYRDKFLVDVLFFAEHRDRELQTICEIARILRENYGLSVAIASVTFHAMISILCVCPKVVVVPFALNENDFPISIFRKVYKNSIVYANMNWEQILHSNNIEYKRPKDSFSKFKFKQLCWGKAHKQFLLESGVEESNIFITGNPSTSLLMKISSKSNLREVIAKKFCLPSNVIWHFFPMNDAWAFTSDYHIKTRIVNGYNPKNAWEYKEYMVKLVNQVIDWFIEMENRSASKEFIIILRPHPSVSVEEYQKIFADKIGYIPKFIYLSKDLSAKEWLVASDTCFTTFSTVALDATCIGKPAYLMEPINFPAFLKMTWHDKLPHIYCYNDFWEKLSKDNHTHSEIITEFKNYVDIQLDGIVETAKCIADFAKEGSFAKKNFFARLLGIRQSYRQTLGSYLRLKAIQTNINFLGLLKPGHRPDYFDREDIIRYMHENVK